MIDFKKKMQEILLDCRNLYLRKSEDYNGKYKISDYLRKGEEYHVYLRNKLQRLDSVLTYKKTNYETAIENLKDFINYAVFYLCCDKVDESEHILTSFQDLIKSIEDFNISHILLNNIEGFDKKRLILHACFLCVLLEEKIFD